MVIIETDDTVVNSIHDVVADAKKKKEGVNNGLYL